MRKITTLCFVIALLAQSCSTNKMFSHKRYGHLNWIDHDSKVETKGVGLDPGNSTEQTSTMKKVENDSKTEAKVTEEEIVLTNNHNSSTPVEIEKKLSEKNQSVSTKTDSNPQDNSQISVEQENTIQKTNQQQEVVTKPASPQMDSDVLLIVCLILCIFIPPLAMYLWDKNTDSWFVIDLVLFLCWFLLIIGPFGFLALGSIVIAFLRVFDLI